MISWFLSTSTGLEKVTITNNAYFSLVLFYQPLKWSITFILRVYTEIREFSVVVSYVMVRYFEIFAYFLFLFFLLPIAITQP